METVVKIQPIEVSKFGQEKKFATQLVITSLSVKLIDSGAEFTFHMLDDNNNVVYNDGHGEFTNAELETWKDSDLQIIDCIVSKLGLIKA